MTGQTHVTENPDRRRFELTVDGAPAGLLTYVVSDDTIDFNHTEVDSDYAGQGLAGVLVQYALDAVRSQGERKVIPSCPYVANWIAKHPDYADLLAE